ncbi:MAG: hypothetical protein GY801_10515 [bacterium]|nr:hypothetical protein [bacterium]
MRNINVVVAGHQFADPVMWILYLADRFKKQPDCETLQRPDRCLVFETKTASYSMRTKAPVHPFLTKEDSYRLLFTQQVDIILHIQSVVAEQLHLTERDLTIVNRILTELPYTPSVFTLLNDSYCGKYHGSVLPDEELNKYVIPGSRVFRTAIGYRPTSGNCSIGADEVFDELLKICKVT